MHLHHWLAWLAVKLAILLLGVGGLFARSGRRQTGAERRRIASGRVTPSRSPFWLRLVEVAGDAERFPSAAGG
jgi:hypothetical protein